jgi:hypothetical protein
MKRTLSAMGAALLLALPSLASAQLVSCTAATTMLAAPGYLDCRGAIVGNINGSAAELAVLDGFGGPWAGAWTFVGKSDDAGNGPFTTSPPADGPANSVLTFDAPIVGKFVIGIKQAEFHSFYLYDSNTPITSIPISSLGTAPDNAGFSHVGVYVTPSSTVPEPSTYALMATGLGALVLMARRRRAT